MTDLVDFLRARLGREPVVWLVAASLAFGVVMVAVIVS